MGLIQRRLPLGYVNLKKLTERVKPMTTGEAYAKRCCWELISSIVNVPWDCKGLPFRGMHHRQLIMYRCTIKGLNRVRLSYKRWQTNTKVIKQGSLLEVIALSIISILKGSPENYPAWRGYIIS